MLKSGECDKLCNLCSCSTAVGKTSEHCSGHGQCTATCTKHSCSNAKCNCEPGWIGSKCEIPGTQRFYIENCQSWNNIPELYMLYCIITFALSGQMRCPYSHPFAYHNGKACCATNKDSWTNEIFLDFDTREYCQDLQLILCPHASCTSYDFDGNTLYISNDHFSLI